MASSLQSDQARRPARSRQEWLGAAAADVAAVVVFAAAGRSTHDESGGVGTVLTVAAPFLIGLAIGWIATPAARVAPASTRTGVGVWIATVALGLLLRRTVWDRGTAVSFVIIATVVLAVLLVGWRALWRIARRHRGLRSAGPPSRAGF